VNLALEFLSAERERLELDRYGIAPEPSFVLLTQRNWTSKYVVFLVFGREPALVVKVVRIPGFGNDWLRREATNLEAAQAARPSGLDTIPRLIALAEVRRRPLLVQTALPGRALDRPALRRNREVSIRRVLDWLRELPRDGDGTRTDPDWFERLVERPIRLAGAGSGDDRWVALVDRTLELVEPLRAAELPLVVEHGDLSPPNLIELRDGRIGVIDWELAEPRGLPLVDFLFFLTYTALAARRASTVARQLQAFDEAFFGPDAWASRLGTAEAERVGIPSTLLTPLLVACWARYVAKLIHRLGPAPLEQESGAYAARTAIEKSTYAELWRHAVSRSTQVCWGPSG
jgi:aminoglycoside phosphotransferase (APT) family kinase protein